MVMAQGQDLRKALEKASKVLVRKHAIGAGTEMDSLQDGKWPSPLDTSTVEGGGWGGGNCSILFRTKFLILILNPNGFV